MNRLIVRPNGPLSGVVRAGGAKNSALKLMAACLLAEGRHTLDNVPDIIDVDIMTEVLSVLGATVTRPEPGVMVIDTPPADRMVPEAPYDLVDKMRASIVVLGPLLARCREARVSMPGGDDFGGRPINYHLDGFSQMGATFEMSHGIVVGSVGTGPTDRLVGAQISLEYPSHTATDNLLMAAVLAKGTTVIENAAREPEVCDLADLLTEMGAVIRGAGTTRIEVEGVDELHPVRHRVIPDRVVVATFLAAAGLAGGEIVVSDGRPEHMDALLRKLHAMGMRIEMTEEGLLAASSGRLGAVDVATLPYPGVATDYKPFMVTMLAVADGVSIVTENLFAGRFRYVDELLRMGADIKTVGNHAVVRGMDRLSGTTVRAHDIRAGATLALAGLVADGETVITHARHIDRGYEDLAGSLQSLGAHVVAE